MAFTLREDHNLHEYKHELGGKVFKSKREK
jgi:hypothetical protein